MNKKTFWFGFFLAVAVAAWILWQRRQEELSLPSLTLADARPPEPPVPPSQPDRLELIRGIGKVFAQRLQDAGVTTYAKLASLRPEQIRAIVGVQPWQADVESWIEQANQLTNA